MTATMKQRLALLTLFLLGLVGSWLLLAAFAAIASASTAAPVVAATDATSAGWDLVAQYGPIWGGAAIAFGLLSRTVRSGLLGQGRWLALATGVVSVLGAVLEWRLGDGQSAGILVTLVIAIKMFMSPTAKSSGATSPGLPTVTLLALALAMVAGCATARRVGAAGAGAFLDCQEHDLREASAELVPMAKQAIVSTIGGTGHVDTATFRAAIGSIRSNAGRCAVDAAIAALTEAVSSPVMAAPMAVDAGELRAVYAAVRIEHGWPEMQR